MGFTFVENVHYTDLDSVNPKEYATKCAYNIFNDEISKNIVF